MIRPPDRGLLDCLAAYNPHVSDLTLALREVVLEEAPNAIESIVQGYAVAIGFSFTGKPLKDGFCHIVTYKTHVNLGFNRVLCFRTLTESSLGLASRFAISRSVTRMSWNVRSSDDISKRPLNR